MDGFYFPFRLFPILDTCKLIRSKTLPLVYRLTTFRSGDSTVLLALLMATREMGRVNIRALDFDWASDVDTKQGWNLYPAIKDPGLELPYLHIGCCVKLLGLCKRLQFLRIRFEEDLIGAISVQAFKVDPGIKALCSIQKIHTVEICGAAEETLGHFAHAE